MMRRSHSWRLNRPSGRPQPGQPRRPIARFRPCLECLEDRITPATAFTVTDNSDNPADPGSLRYAINNLTAGANSITFAPGLAGQTITLTNGELLISQGVVVTGPGAGLLTISGNN